MVKKCLALAALLILALAAAGCPLLMAGSLGYEGYEYEKTGSLPGFPSNPPPSAEQQTKPAPSPSDRDIE